MSGPSASCSRTWRCFRIFPLARTLPMGCACGAWRVRTSAARLPRRLALSIWPDWKNAACMSFPAAISTTLVLFTLLMVMLLERLVGLEFFVEPDRGRA